MKIVLLGEVVRDVRSGFASGKDDVEGVVQVRMNNISTDGQLNWGKIRRVPRPKKIDELLVQPGDILFNATNSPELVGKSAIFVGYHEPVTFSNHFLRVRINNLLAEPAFVARVLQERWSKRVFAGMCKRWVNQASIGKDDLLALQIPLPPLDEQKRIAAILDQADALRRLRQRAIDRLNELGQAIFYEMFGPMLHDVGPWPSRQFATLVQSAKIGLVRGASELGDSFGTPYVRMDAIQRDGTLDLRNVKRAFVSQDEADAFALMVGDFLFNTRNSKELVGKSTVADSRCEGMVYNNNILRVRFVYGVSSYYISHYFRQPFAVKELEARKSGTTSVFAIYQKSIDTIPVALPPFDLQKEFECRINASNEVRRAFAKEADVADALFSSLQHRAFTNQL